MSPDPPAERRSTPLGTLAAALLRTIAWVYGALWLIVAATAPWGPPGLLAVVLLLPVAPLVLLATLRSLTRRPEEGLRNPAPDGGGETAAARAQAFLSSPPRRP